MDMHCKDAVSTVPNFLEVRHRPNHNGTLERCKGSNSSCCRTVNSNGRRAVRLVAPVTSTTRRWLSSKSDTKGRGPPVFERHQQKPGRGVYRRPSSKEYVGVGQGQEGEAGKAGSPEVGTQPFDSGRQPVRTAAPAGVQDAVEGRSSRRRAAPEHKPQVSCVPSHSSTESQDPKQLRVRRVWLLRPCGLGWCDKHQRGGTRLVSLSVIFACCQCVVSGTHRGHRMRECTAGRNPLRS